MRTWNIMSPSIGTFSRNSCFCILTSSLPSILANCCRINVCLSCGIFCMLQIYFITANTSSEFHFSGCCLDQRESSCRRVLSSVNDQVKDYYTGGYGMVLNATFNNIAVISWRSVILVEEIGIPGENHRPAASHWQTLSHNVVSSTPRLSRNA